MGRLTHKTLKLFLCENIQLIKVKMDFDQFVFGGPVYRVNGTCIFTYKYKIDFANRDEFMNIGVWCDIMNADKTVRYPQYARLAAMTIYKNKKVKIYETADKSLTGRILEL